RGGVRGGVGWACGRVRSGMVSFVLVIGWCQGSFRSGWLSGVSKEAVGRAGFRVFPSKLSVATSVRLVFGCPQASCRSGWLSGACLVLVMLRNGGIGDRAAI